MWSKQSTREQNGLLLLTLFAGALRFGWLGKDCLWLDEFNWLSWSTTPDILATAGPMYPHSPFFALLMRPFAFLFESDFGLRLLPAAIGTLSVPVVFILGKSLFDARIGRTAAFLTAVCPIHIIYSRQFLPYSLLFFSMCVYAWLVWESVGKDSIWLLAGVSLSVAASLYAQIYSVFSIAMIFLAIAACLLFSGQRYARLFKLSAAHCLGLLLYIPWGRYIALTQQTRYEKGDASTEDALYVLQSVMSSLWRGNQKADDLLTGPLLLLVFLLLLASLANLKKHPLPYLVVLSWSVSWTGVFFVSRWVNYQFDGRYALGALPGLILLLALGVRGFLSLPSKLLPWLAEKRRWTPIVAGVIPVILLAWNAGVLIHYYSAGPLEEYQSLLPWLERTTGNPDALVTSIGRGKMICQRYSRELAVRMEEVDPDDLLKTIQSRLEEGKRVWCLCRWTLPKPLEEWIGESKTPSIQLGGDIIFACLLASGAIEKQEDLDQAARGFLESALDDFSPHPTPILMKLGRLAATNAGDDGSRRAGNCFDAAIRENEWRRWIAPTSYEVHRVLAECHFGAAHFLQAVREYEAAQRLVEGGHKKASAKLAEVSRIKAAEEFEKAGNLSAAAEAYLQVYASSNPKEPNWWVMAAMMEAKLNNIQKSLETLAAIEKVHPESWYAASKRGEVLLLDKQVGAAREAFLKAVKLNRRDGHSLIRLGDIARANRNRSEALGYYEKALALGGDFRGEAQMALRALNQP